MTTSWAGALGEYEMAVPLSGYLASDLTPRRSVALPPEEIARLKQQPGENLLMVGSTRIAHTFTQLGLIDEYWLNVNPVVLGSGNPLFADIKDQIKLQLISAKTYASGVVGLHYQKG